MNIRYSVIFLISMYNIAHAQTQLDSIFGVWEDRSLPDSTRAIAFNKYISNGFFYIGSDSAIALTKELFKFSEKAGYKAGMVDALSALGYAYFITGKYSEALESYKKGLHLAEKENDKEGTAYLLLKTGYIYHDNGDLIMALSFYQRSLDIFEEIDDKNGVGSVYNEFGNIYSAKNESDKALGYFRKAIAINEELDREHENSALYLNMGRVYLDLDSFPKALDYFQKALTIDKREDDKLGIASGLGSIGDLYISRGDYDKALDYLQRSLMITEEIKDIQGSTANLLSIGKIYTLQGRHDNAIKYCKKSLTLALGLGDLDDQLYSCECLYTAYKAVGDANEALTYHEQMLLLSDSLKIGETARKIQSMEFSRIKLLDSLSQVEKDIKVQMLHREEVRKKENNRNIAQAVGVFFLFLSGSFYSRWRYVRKSSAIIEREKDRSDNLLLNILPSEIAEELKAKGSAEAKEFDMVSILLSDFVGFTQVSEKLSAKELVTEIDYCFQAFDHICEKYGVEKIKTIGDAYMAAGGLTLSSENSVVNTVVAALEMQSFIISRKKQREAKNEMAFEMRVGIHTGPVVAGIVGVKKFQYDIWGDTVNTASRMESSGAIAKVNISQNTYEMIKADQQFIFESRGKIQAKGKGEIEMYFVTSRA